MLVGRQRLGCLHRIYRAREGICAVGQAKAGEGSGRDSVPEKGILEVRVGAVCLSGRRE